LSNTSETASPTLRSTTGVLLTNLGTPDDPSTASVRRYLAEFLWDPRVIELPRILWWVILRVILLIRPARSAAKYQKIWTEQGSPLLVNLVRQADALRSTLEQRSSAPPTVGYAMRYGQPSIENAITDLCNQGVEKLLVLPLYPQYSATTTASTFDAVAAALERRRKLPALRFVTRYGEHTGYLSALVESIESYWTEQGRPQKLLFSFHGLPQRYVDNGDPYQQECQATAQRVAAALGLDDDMWHVSYQSRVGREQWLRPYTDETLAQWGRQGVQKVNVICPGFSADCLETLEEIDDENREIFVDNGGGEYAYIAALNDRPRHIEALTSLVETELRGWQEGN